MATTRSLPQGFEAARDVEALMERMRQLQESLLRDEGASQEEMESRFELEKSESLLVTPSGTGSQVSRFRGRPLLTSPLLGSRYLHALHLCSHIPATTGLIYLLPQAWLLPKSWSHSMW